MTFDPEVDLSDVVVKIQFTTANGVRWEVPTKAETSGDPCDLANPLQAEHTCW
jgi:hypothetical protein